MAAMILAAGAATRMGKLKQLLSYEGKTFLQRAIASALEAEFHPVVVVVGAEADAVRASIAAERVLIAGNPEWKQGMGASISAGVKQLQNEHTEVAALAILLSDQPLVQAAHLRRMRTEFHRSGAAIVAAEYSDTLGVPALFSRSLLETLAQLPPQAGARALFSKAGLKVQPFPLPEAAIDVDTPDDLAALPFRHRPA